MTDHFVEKLFNFLAARYIWVFAITDYKSVLHLKKNKMAAVKWRKILFQNWKKISRLDIFGILRSLIMNRAFIFQKLKCQTIWLKKYSVFSKPYIYGFCGHWLSK